MQLRAHSSRAGRAAAAESPPIKTITHISKRNIHIHNEGSYLESTRATNPTSACAQKICELTSRPARRLKVALSSLVSSVKSSASRCTRNMHSTAIKCTSWSGTRVAAAVGDPTPTLPLAMWLTPRPTQTTPLFGPTCYYCRCCCAAHFLY